MKHLLYGTCEAVHTAQKGLVVEMTLCGAPGIERRDLRPDRVLAEILCDDHYEAELARR